MRCKCGKAEKKCLVYAVTKAHAHKGFKVSAKLCLNLSSHKWAKPTHSLLGSFIPTGSWIL